MVLEQGTGFLGPHVHLQFSPRLIEAHLQGQTVNHFQIPEVIQVVGACQGVYPDLQRLEGAPFLLEG